ncbi:MAG: cobalt-precorrin 5A hydrolase [Deltaproteobacteria bacterium]|nr:cobalt-precorrin 5A hydrolase [Deltaproteobacteria bacterium]
MVTGSEKTAIYALTPQGARLGHALADKLRGDLFLSTRLAGSHGAIPFDRLLDAVAGNFSSYPRHVFIAAAGIVVRAVAPHLKSKDRDPAVVVLDQEGEYVISLLSGHLGGANELARKVAQLTGGKAVITTATDTAGVPAIDVLAKERNLSIANLEAVKSVNMALLAGEPVQVFDPEDRLGLKNQKRAGFVVERIDNRDQWISRHAGVWVTWNSKDPGSETSKLILHPKCLVAGIGCNLGTRRQEIVDLIKDTFKKNMISIRSLKCITTIEAKKNEHGLLKAARELDVPLIFAGKSELESIEVPHPSGVVKKHMGVSSVCEATALLKTGGGRLLVPKTKSLNATLAVTLES